MGQQCDGCGHVISTMGGNGRFSIHDVDGNEEDMILRRRLPAGGVRCPGSLLHPVSDEAGTSIRTVSGGLPGLGKRR